MHPLRFTCVTILVIAYASHDTVGFSGCTRGHYVHGFHDDFITPLPNATCVPCEPETYNDVAELQVLVFCLACRRRCDANDFERELQACTSTNDRVCGCHTGYFPSSSDLGRPDCRIGNLPSLLDCPPGQMRIKVGGGQTDECAICPPGKLDCSDSDIFEEEASNANGNHTIIYIVVAVILLALVIGISAMVIYFRKRPPTNKNERTPIYTPPEKSAHWPPPEAQPLTVIPPNTNAPIHAPDDTDRKSDGVAPTAPLYPSISDNCVNENERQRTNEKTQQTASVTDHRPHQERNTKQKSALKWRNDIKQDDEETGRKSTAVNPDGTGVRLPTQCSEDASITISDDKTIREGTMHEEEEAGGKVEGGGGPGPASIGSGYSTPLDKGHVSDDQPTHLGALALPNESLSSSVHAQSVSDTHVFSTIFEDLVNILSPENIVDGLRTKGLISQKQYETIMLPTNTRTDKSRIILDYVIRKENKGVAVFLQINCATTETHVAKKVLEAATQREMHDLVHFIKHYVREQNFEELQLLLKELNV